MSMTTEQALDYFKKNPSEDKDSNKVASEQNNSNSEAEKPKSDEEKDSSTATSTVELKNDKKEVDESTETKEKAPKADAEPKAEVKDSGKGEEKTSKPKPTKQEQIDFAFAKEKAKRKRLESRIKALEEELKNTKNKTQSDFNNNIDEYVAYMVDKKTKENELNRTKQDVIESRNAEYEQVNEKRIADCFPDENERNTYLTMVKQHGKEFLNELDTYDPEGVVLGYLDDSDIAPLLIRVLMSSDKYRNDVLSKTSPYSRAIAIDRLASGIRYAKDKLNEQKAQQTQQTTETVQPVQEKPLPIIGSITKSDDSSNANVVPNWQDRLRKLNAARGRT